MQKSEREMARNKIFQPRAEWVELIFIHMRARALWESSPCGGGPRAAGGGAETLIEMIKCKHLEKQSDKCVDSMSIGARSCLGTKRMERVGGATSLR